MHYNEAIKKVKHAYSLLRAYAVICGRYNISVNRVYKKIGDVNMNMTSHGIVDIKGCQHSKHISISIFQTERFPKWVKMMYLLEI